MRYTTALAVFAVILSLALQSEAQIDPESVVGVWLFEGDPRDGVLDSSGNGHDGEIVGNVKWAEGKFGRGLEFPGASGSMVKVPSTDALSLNTFTVVTWYKGEATDSWQYIVSKEIPHTARNYSIGVQKDSGVIMVQVTVGELNWKTATGKTVLTDEEWHHMAGTYDGGLMKAWVNGIMEGQTGQPDEPDHLEEQPLTIGAVNGIPVKGFVDEVALFNVALEEEDIQDIMNNGLEATLDIIAVNSAGKLAVTWGEIRDR